MNKQLVLFLLGSLLINSCTKDELVDIQISNEETISSQIVKKYYFSEKKLIALLNKETEPPSSLRRGFIIRVD